MHSCVIENNIEGGIGVIDGDATIADSVIRATLPGYNDLFGDGIDVWALEQPATAVVTGSLIVQNARVGIGSFGAKLSLGKTALECNAIHLDGEASMMTSYEFEDLGEDTCGCAPESDTCRVVTSNLAPPDPVP